VTCVCVTCLELACVCICDTDTREGQVVARDFVCVWRNSYVCVT